MAEPSITLGVGIDERQAFQAGRALSESVNRGMSSLPLGRITGKSNEFQKSLEASNARVLAFGASAGAIYALKVAFDELVSSTINVEKKLSEINVFLNLSTRSLQGFSSDLFEVASKTGQSFNDAALAAQQFARQGLSVSETLKRTNDALVLSRLSGLGVAESVASLTGIINSFGKEALNTTMIVDKLTNVGSHFAVSSSDLADALKRAGTSASEANVHFDEMIGLITSAQQITARGGSIIGNSFKTIFTRLERPKVLDDLEAVGIAVRDANGKTKPLIEVLSNLANQYESLSSTQRSFISETVGGVFQINVLKAVLGDLGNGFSIYKSSVDAAANSTFSAQKRISSLNQTISSQLVVAGNDWTRALSNIGNLGASSPIRGVISFAQKTGKSIGDNTDSSKENDGGAKIIQGGIKTIGTLISGPGIQMAVFAIFKLFERLAVFAADSVKDFGGLNKAAKDRADVERSIIESLTMEEETLNGILNGTISITQATSGYLSKIEQTRNTLEQIKLVTDNIVGSIERSGNLKVTADVARRDVANRETSYVPNASMGEVLGRKSYSGSFAPNLSNSPIAEALRRENKATRGRGKISSHPSLITSQNPFGLVAIDGGTQRTATEAIAQHMAMGQSMNQIKSAGSAIPNLATDSSEMVTMSSLLALAQWGRTVDFANKEAGFLQKNFKALYDVTTQQIITDQEYIKGHKQATSDLTYGRSVQFGVGGDKKEFNSLSQFNNATAQEKVETENRLKEASRQREISENKTRSTATKFMIGGGTLAGLGSEAAKSLSSNTDIAKGVETLGQKITTASQILYTFPNSKFAKGAATGMALQGGLEGFQEYRSKIGSKQDALDLQKDKTQKLVTNLDQLAQSISSLNNMTLDETVTIAALERENRKYYESLANLSGQGASSKEIEDIKNAPDSKTKIKLATELRDRKTQELDVRTSDFEFDKRVANSKGVTNRVLNRGGIYGWNSNEEKGKSEDESWTQASSFIQRLTKEEKDKLEKKFQTPQGRRDFSLDDLTQDGAHPDIAERVKELRNSGNKNDEELIRNKTAYLFNQGAMEKNPDLINARKSAIQNNEQASAPLEANFRRQAILEGARANVVNSTVDNTINRQRLGVGGIEDAFSSRSLALQIKGNKVKNQGLVFSEFTNQQAELGLDSERIGSESNYKQDILNNKTSKNLSDNFTKGLSFEKSGTGKKDEFGMDVTEVSPQKLKIADAFSTGLNKTLTDNNGLTNFKDKKGNFNYEGFQKQILDNSGLSKGDNSYKQLSEMVDRQKDSVEILQIISEYTNESVQISSQATDAIKKNTEQQRANKEDYETKRSANFLGGTKSLTDRDYGRQLQRDIKKGSYLAENGSSDIVKGQGAAMVLKRLGEMGVATEVDHQDKKTGEYIGKNGNKLSAEVTNLLNIASRGVTANNERISGRLGNSTIANEIRNYQNTSGKLAGSNAVGTEFKPDGANLIKGAAKSTADTLSEFDAKLTAALQPLNNFSLSVATYSGEIQKLIQERPALQKNKNDVREQGIKDTAAISNILNIGAPKKSDVEVSDGSKQTYSGTTLELGNKFGTILATGIIYSLGDKLAGKGLSKLGGLFKSSSNVIPTGTGGITGNVAQNGGILNTSVSGHGGSSGSSNLNGVNYGSIQEASGKYPPTTLDLYNKYNKKEAFNTEPTLATEQALFNPPAKTFNQSDLLFPKKKGLPNITEAKYNTDIAKNAEKQHYKMGISDEELHAAQNEQFQSLVQATPEWQKIQERRAKASPGSNRMRKVEYSENKLIAQMGEKYWNGEIGSEIPSTPIQPAFIKTLPTIQGGVEQGNIASARMNPEFKKYDQNGKATTFKFKNEIPSEISGLNKKGFSTSESSIANRARKERDNQNYQKALNEYQSLPISAQMNAESPKLRDFNTSSEFSSFKLSNGNDYKNQTQRQINNFNNSKLGKGANWVGQAGLAVGGAYAGNKLEQKVFGSNTGLGELAGGTAAPLAWQALSKSAPRIMGALGPAAGIIGAGVAGYQAGEYINDRYIGSIDRKGQEAKDAYKQQLQDSPALAMIMRKKNQIDNINYNSNLRLQDNNIGVISKQKITETRDTAIQALTKEIEELKNNGLKINEESNIYKQAISQGSNSNISIEISLKDAENIPQNISDKIIAPLKAQLMAMQTQLNSINQRSGGTNTPAKVS